MKPKRSGLTLVEILVVVGIIALLTGMLIPAISTVTRVAKEAKQKAQLTAIELGLEAFKNDFGDYPPSDAYTWTENKSVESSAGALKLSEAMLGLDLLGVHPDTGWRVDGKNRWSYQVNSTTYAAGTYNLYDKSNTTDMQKRKGRYVEMDAANPFRLGSMFDLTRCGSSEAAADCFALCDVFGKGPNVTQSDGTRARAGRPILYYRANPAYKFVDSTSSSAYTSTDNGALLTIVECNDELSMGQPSGKSVWNPLVVGLSTFVSYVADPRASTTGNRVPYRPDSYILVSAGADGFYGTSDDIHNFGR